MKKKIKIELISDKNLPPDLKKIVDDMDKLFKKMVKAVREGRN
jgi:hypothetical protein